MGEDKHEEALSRWFSLQLCEAIEMLKHFRGCHYLLFWNMCKYSLCQKIASCHWVQKYQQSSKQRKLVRSLIQSAALQSVLKLSTSASQTREFSLREDALCRQTDSCLLPPHNASAPPASDALHSGKEWNPQSYSLLGTSVYICDKLGWIVGGSLVVHFWWVYVCFESVGNVASCVFCDLHYFHLCWS